MPKYQDNPIYAIAQRFVDVALRRDDSLFTPGRAIWAAGPLDELYSRYVQNPDLGSGSFESKLRDQLGGASPEAVQLMAEALFVYYLPARWNISGAVKRQNIGQVLAWIPNGPTMPADLVAVTDHGVGSGGPGFHLYKWASLSFLLSFVRRWKQAPKAGRDEALSDPWKFHDFVAQIPTDGGGIYARESLLHMVFPDTFERLFSGRAKHLLAETLKSFVTDPDTDVDRRLAQIRSRLSERFGPEFDFYDTDGVRALWRSFDDPRDEFIYWASRFHELGNFAAEERTYKLDIVARLTAAKAAFLNGADWFPLLKKAFAYPPNNLTSLQSHSPFLKWCEEDLHRARKLVRRIWADDGEPLTRLDDFLAHLPVEVVTGMGARTTLGSFLLMAIDPYEYPPYRTAALHAAYRLTKFDPGEEKSEGAMYRAGIKFMDELRERAADRGVDLLDRLDAQSVAWCIASWDAPDEWPPEDRAAFDRYRHGAPGQGDESDGDELPEPPIKKAADGAAPYEDPLVALSDDLLISHPDLVEMRDLLRTKRQLIAYGPPGTGKTYVAQKLAVAIAGDKARVRLVQFHPSYAYEDFVEGFRPKAIGGVPGFELTAGPMKTLAAQATEDPGHDYFLIIDELNRGNVAKIFGELYFLLEYRDEELLLQYSAQPFRLPKNLFVIGTMNTADRSIALLDAALRRRFVFMPFFPDRPPIQGVLRRWLQRHRTEMSFVADLVDLANRKLADRNAAIGPSFFMDAALNEQRLARVWRHEIMPLLEDYFFDAPERLKEFEIDRLKKELSPSGNGEDAASSASTPQLESGLEIRIDGSPQSA